MPAFIHPYLVWRAVSRIDGWKLRLLMSPRVAIASPNATRQHLDIIKSRAHELRDLMQFFTNVYHKLMMTYSEGNDRRKTKKTGECKVPLIYNQESEINSKHFVCILQYVQAPSIVASQTLERYKRRNVV